MNKLNTIQAYKLLLSRSGELRSQQKQEAIYAEMIRLSEVRDRVLAMLPPPRAQSSRLRRAIQALLNQGEIRQRYQERLAALYYAGLTHRDCQQQQAHLLRQQERELANLPSLPLLSLEEQACLQQEILRFLINQYVDQTLEQLKIHLHFQSA